MWIPKWQRDRNKGVDSPMPTQIVSDEEILPRPQHAKQKEWEARIGTIADDHSAKLGMARRDFMRSSMGLAAVFWAQNEVYGQRYWDVDREELWEPAAYAEKWRKGEDFIFDVQAHFTNGVALRFREHEFLRNMGFKLSSDPEAYSFQTFFKEMLLDSETDMLVISGVPGRENNTDDTGKTLEGNERGGGVLPSWLMAARRDDINSIAGAQRALAQSNCAPNHYWNRTTDTQDKVALKEQMTREVERYKSSSWKLYCHFDPARTGRGFQLDDEATAYFYEVARGLGLKTVSVHKGYSSQSRRFGHLANPKDVEGAALENPDFTFIVYHSALKHDPYEPQVKEPGYYDPDTGDFEWHSTLMDIKKRNPEMQNVHCEIGSAFGTLAIEHPEMCMHLMGKNIKHYGADHVIWGTDCLWWGSPQWAIDAFKRFQISDELCEKFGYQKLTKQDKQLIFGLNAAKLYNVDVDKTRRRLEQDDLTKIRARYHGEGLQPENNAHGWVRAD